MRPVRVVTRACLLPAGVVRRRRANEGLSCSRRPLRRANRRFAPVDLGSLLRKVAAKDTSFAGPRASASGASPARMRGTVVALVGLVLCLASASAPGAEPEEVFERANSLYVREAYDGALQLYREIIEDGWEAPGLYYNAANCHLRMGEMGMALLMYRRAQRLAPGDDDIKANLTFVRALAEGGALRPEGSRLLNVLLAPHRSLSVDGATAIVSVSAFVLALFLCLRVLHQRRIRLWSYCAAAAAVVFFGMSTSLGAKLHAVRASTEAVVVARSTDVRSGPGEDFVVQTTLAEGAEVEVKRTGGDWTEISLGPEFAGWVRSGDVEVI